MLPVPASAAWEPVGPWGGPAEVVRVVPDVRDAVVAATRSGVVLTSADGGGTWRELPFPGRSTGVLHALEIDPRLGSVWFLGMEGSRPAASGVYRTTDAGQTWSQLPGMQGIAVWSLAFSPSNPDILAAGTESGIYLTRDNGAHWSLFSPAGHAELKPVVSLAFDPRDSRVLYAGTTHLPWKTSDGGATWQSIHTGMLDDSDVFSVAVDPRRPDRVLASACSGAYGSRDGGRRWARFATPRGAFRVYFISFDPRHPEVIFAGTSSGLLRSANEGVAWTRVSTSQVKALAFDRFDERRVFFASVDAGLLVSRDDGVTVTEANVGFANRAFTGLVADGRALYVTGPTGLYRSNDAGAHWSGLGGPTEGGWLAVAPVPGQSGVLLAAGYRGLGRSVDGGRRWQAEAGFPVGLRVRALLAGREGVVLAGTERGVYRSAVPGGWTQVSATAGEALFAVGARALIAVGNGATQWSEDNGASWRACGPAVPGATWYGVAGSASTPAALAATSRGVFRTTDACRTWTAVGGGLLSATATAVVFHPTRTSEAFVAQGGQVWRSLDAGETWHVVPSQPDQPVWPSSLVLLATDPGRLFGLVPGRGVFVAGELAGPAESR